MGRQFSTVLPIICHKVDVLIVKKILQSTLAPMICYGASQLKLNCLLGSQSKGVLIQRKQTKKKDRKKKAR